MFYCKSFIWKLTYNDFTYQGIYCVELNCVGLKNCYLPDVALAKTHEEFQFNAGKGCIRALSTENTILVRRSNDKTLNTSCIT